MGQLPLYKWILIVQRLLLIGRMSIYGKIHCINCTVFLGQTSGLDVSISNISVSSSQILAEIKTVKKELKRTKTILQLDELKCRKRVLRR